MSGTIELTTERLLLRRYRLDDARILYEEFGCDPQSQHVDGAGMILSSLRFECLRDGVADLADVEFSDFSVPFYDMIHNFHLIYIKDTRLV